MRHRILPLALVAGIGFAAILVVLVSYSDLLGARLIGPGKRVAIQQGAAVTLQISSATHARKLELCTEKRAFLMGQIDFSQCQPLLEVLPAAQTNAEVVIPAHFPIGRAIVITRDRDAQGVLQPVAPANEKIALLVKTAPSEPTPSTSVLPSASPALQEVCIDPETFRVSIRWAPASTVIAYRTVGEPNWHYPYSFETTPYVDVSNSRQAFIFKSDSRYKYPLPPNTDFEFRFEAPDPYPPSLQPSKIYQFNSGALPTGADESKSPCEFRKLF